MPTSQNYPSPNAAQVGHGTDPFFSAPHQAPQLPRAEALDFAARLSREVASSQNRDINDGSTLEVIADSQDRTRSPQEHFALVDTNSEPLTEVERVARGSARKKSKVSRACDECRRKKVCHYLVLQAPRDMKHCQSVFHTDSKKIRCDADVESPSIDKCSNCKRTNSSCGFSRQPMKRGPSKG